MTRSENHKVSRATYYDVTYNSSAVHFILLVKLASSTRSEMGPLSHLTAVDLDISHIITGDQEGDGQGSQRIETCLFDLDDTLYPYSRGLAAACKTNIQDFLSEKLGVDASKAPALSLQLYLAHGTTMAGLRARGFVFDFDDYHAFVHGRLPYERLEGDPVLRSILKSLPQRKVMEMDVVTGALKNDSFPTSILLHRFPVFTNSDKAHAARCLSLLGLHGCFDAVICFEQVQAHPPFEPHPNSIPAPGPPSDEGMEGSWRSGSGPLICCKPQPEAFRRALALAGAVPSSTVFFDDSVQNISAAKQLGIGTVLVGKGEPIEGADYVVPSLHDLPHLVPHLWNIGGEKI